LKLETNLATEAKEKNRSNYSDSLSLGSYSGTGAGMDIVVSSVKAYVGALNKMLGFKEHTSTLSKTPLETNEVPA